MFRRLIPLVVGIVVVVGCKKKDNSSGDGGDPNATYTIKIREAQKGDKSMVVKTRSGSQTITVGGQTLTQKEQEHFAYTESILEIPADTLKPTKVTRAYTTAEKTDKGVLKPLSYANKTVTIEKKGATYSFTVDGKTLPLAELVEFRNEFEKVDKSKIADLFPKHPVKVGETWDIDLANISALIGSPQFTLDKEKSKVTGKFVRVFTKDGQQWGVIEIKVEIAIAPGANGASLTGTISSDITIETAIDGSVYGRTMRVTGNGNISNLDPRKGETKISIEGSQEQSVTPMK